VYKAVRFVMIFLASLPCYGRRNLKKLTGKYAKPAPCLRCALAFVPTNFSVRGAAFEEKKVRL
jgi:hypothetical protein